MSSSGVTPPNYEVRPAVRHGANTNTARPATSAVVEWYGTVRPLNAAAQDVYWNEQADLPERYDGAAWHVQGAAAYVAVIGPANGTDDLATIQALLDAVRTAGGGTVKGLQGQAYKLSAPPRVGSGTTLDLTGCTVTLNAGSNSNLIQNYGATPVATASDGAITSGSAVLTTAVTASVGQSVTVAGAGNGGNSPLCGKVTAVGGGTVTLDTAASATVASGGAVKVYNRDTNVRVLGGVWKRGSNVGTGTDLHSLFFRHVDGLTVDIEGFTSAAGKYAVSIADATDVWARARGLAAFSDGVHLMGPISGARIEEVAGTTGDDCFAITAADWSPYNDCCGDVLNVSIGDIIATSTAARCAVVTAGNSQFVDNVKVTGGIYGASATNAVRVGEDTGQAQTTGGTFGSIDLGLIAATAPTPGAQLNIVSAAAKRIRARLRNKQTSGLNRSVYVSSGTTTVTLEALDLEVDVDGVGNANLLAAVEVNSSITTINRLTIEKSRYTNPTGLVSPLYLHSSGTVKEADLIACRHDGNGQVGYTVRQTGGTLNRVNFIGGTSDNTNVAVRKEGSDTTVVTFAGGFSSRGASRVADSRAGTTVYKLAGCHFDTITNAAFFTNAGTLVFYGDLMTTAGTFTMLQRQASETVTAYGNSLPFDLSMLARVIGEYCTDALNKTTTGAIPVVCTTTAAGGWKNVNAGTF